MKWESVIGLEVHIQLSTKSKLFSGSSTQFGAEPNTQANVVDLAMPGVLPVLNHEAVNMAIKFGLAVDAEINLTSVFARKNYFYPDLPKGYQISQYELPIVGKGFLDIFESDGSSKRIGITRAHLEEDAGKSLHEDFHGFTGVDLNRAGTPLLEIVSEPELRSASEAVNYLKTLHSLVRYLGICDGNMQEGSFRCDANVSVRRPHEPLGTRVEIKNLNSFRFIERAINYEIERQIEAIENGEEISQETRLYDANKNTTRVMRSKEDANDYRYFPDPDLLPLLVSEKTIEKIRSELPELPAQKRERFMTDYELSLYDASILANNLDTSNYFETVLQESGVSPKLAANWVIVELASVLNKLGLSIETSPVSASALALLLKRIKDETISGKIAKTVFEAMCKGEGSADEIIERNGLKQVTDSSAIEKIVDEVIANSPQQLADYRTGKDRLFGYFVGQVMKASGGKANPEQVNALLKQKLHS